MTPFSTISTFLYRNTNLTSRSTSSCQSTKMPPKTAEIDNGAHAIVALCHIMATCDEFTMNGNKLAPLLGITGTKNM